ncbi:MAG: hypothetical protein FD169_1051 [Bacillota bacterium]|nr:MAG: hypothetical protein FD169_1051 [Bacillota bacterium]
MIDKEKMSHELKNRLNRIEGQVRGVHKLIDNQATCEDVLIQLAAIKAAVEQVGMKVLGCYMADAVAAQVQQGQDPTSSIDQAIKLLGRLG